MTSQVLSGAGVFLKTFLCDIFPQLISLPWSVEARDEGRDRTGKRRCLEFFKQHATPPCRTLEIVLLVNPAWEHRGFQKDFSFLLFITTLHLLLLQRSDGQKGVGD